MGVIEGSVQLGTLLWTVFSALLSGAIAYRSIKKRSLDTAGAITAFCVGLVTIGTHAVFGVVLLTFFVTSSAITKLGARTKAAVYAEFKEGGQRNGQQVIANSAWALLASLIWLSRWGFSRAVFWPVLPADVSQASAADIFEVFSAFLALQVCIAHYGVCCGDTWASEIGSAFAGAPRLVLPPFRRVPRGTNGGVTIVGTLASAAGGLTVGLAAAATLLLLPWAAPASAAAPAAAAVGASTAAAALPASASALLAWCQSLSLSAAPLSSRLPLVLLCALTGLCAGVAGSLVDSVLGATLQLTAVGADGRVVDDAAAASAMAAGRRGEPAAAVAPESGAGGGYVRKVAGWHVLNNNQVNLLSSFALAFVTAVYYLVTARGAAAAFAPPVWGLALVGVVATVAATLHQLSDGAHGGHIGSAVACAKLGRKAHRKGE